MEVAEFQGFVKKDKTQICGSYHLSFFKIYVILFQS